MSGSKQVLAVVVMAMSSGAFAEEYFVSIGRGKGKDATKEKPAKDLGNIAAKLKDGDVVNVAEGVYLGRDESGSDSIGAAVKLVGGWADDFSKRDPWGAHKTVFTGVGTLKGSTQARLIMDAKACKADQPMVIDGIIFDNGPRNRYGSADKLAILRKANMGKDENATPESGGVVMKLGRECTGLVQNVVVMNTAPTGGALQVWGHEKTKATIRNNLVINNTGEGIFVLSQFKAREPKGLADFVVDHNTVLFAWKHDPIATYGGNGLKMDQELTLAATANVFAFGDYGGVDNIKLAKGITLKGNLFTGNRLYDYREFNTTIKVSELEDEADQLTKESTGNVSKEIKVPMAARWANLYAGRKEISRAAVDASAKASNSGANQLRGMLGLPLQANAVATDADVFLPLMTIDEALPAGEKAYDGLGCTKP